jgi:uncharacterized membrane protein YoaK (UPF0700 family)
LLAAGLAALAGFVDATGFIASGGFFASFMSGNTTRLGVALTGNGGQAAIAASLIASFVFGVVAGTLVGRAAGGWRRPVILLLLAVVLAVAAVSGRSAFLPAIMIAAFAMGAENTVFEAGGDVAISLTYMTGNLVKIGQRIALALRGGDALGWLPFLMLWLAMVGGAVGGAAVWPHLGLAGLWVAASSALLLAAASAALGKTA